MAVPYRITLKDTICTKLFNVATNTKKKSNTLNKAHQYTRHHLLSIFIIHITQFCVSTILRKRQFSHYFYTNRRLRIWHSSIYWIYKTDNNCVINIWSMIRLTVSTQSPNYYRFISGILQIDLSQSYDWVNSILDIRA